MTTIKHKMILALVLLILIASGVAYTIFKGQPITPKEPLEPEQTKTVNLLDIMAEVTQEGLIDPQTGFTLSMDMPIDASYIRDTLKVTPSFDYQLEQVSDTTYHLKPKTAFEKGQVVAMSFQNQERLAGWAFQVSDQLKVKATYPAMGADKVPLNAGIEITFNAPIDSRVLDYVTILPEIQFTSQVKEDVLIIMTEGLTNDIRYEVTVKEGYMNPLGAVLEEASVFSFVTDGTHRTIDTHTFDMKLFQSNEPIILGGMYSSNDEVPVKVYQVGDPILYEDMIQRHMSNFDVYKYPNDYLDLDTLPLVMDETIKLITQYYNQFVVLPEMNSGYYIVVLRGGSTERLVFMQVSQEQVYLEASNQHTLIWLVDQDGQGLADAKVTSTGDLITKTNGEGTTIIPYDVGGRLTRIEWGDQTIFLPLYDRTPYHGMYDVWHVLDEANQQPFSREDLVQSFLYTDRSVYRVDDQLDVFGFSVLKDKREMSRVIVTLTNSYQEVVRTQSVTLNTYNVYRSTIDLTGLEEDGYRLEVRFGQKLLASKFIEIKAFVKPELVLSSRVAKSVLGPRESVRVSGRLTYFDDSAAVGYPLSVNGYTWSNNKDHSQRKLTTTNETGDFALDFTPEYVYYTSEPFTMAINVTNEGAENVDVKSTNEVHIYPSEVILTCEIEAQENDQLLILVKTRALQLPSEQIFNPQPDQYAGENLSQTVSVRVEESYYEKKEIGEVYNPILKTVEKQYDYTYKNQTVLMETLDTVNGLGMLQLPYLPNRTYSVWVTTEDTPGHTIEAYQAFYGNFSPYEDSLAPSPLLEGPKYYTIGETISFDLVIPDEIVKESNPSTDHTLFILYQGGYFDHQVVTDTTFKTVFDETMVPNIVVKGVYFDGKKFRASDGMATAAIGLNNTEKHLDITIQPDKKTYKPGDEVTLKLKTTLKGQPIAAQTLVNVVDEAYYALFPEATDVYETFYQWQHATRITYFYHSGYFPINSMAEMGEGDSDEAYMREDFKDTAAFLEVTTDEHGVGQVTFRLPDNITKWRLTAHGVTGSYDVGTSREHLVVTLPFYVRLLMDTHFITGEQPVLHLRAGGDQLKTSEEATYEVLLENNTGLSQSFTRSAKVDQMADVALPVLEKGAYQLTVKGTHQSFQDALILTFEVLDSRVQMEAIRVSALNQQFRLTDPSVRTTLYFLHDLARERMEKLNALQLFKADRLEWLVASYEASRLLRGQTDKVLPDLLRDFQSPDGGLKPLINAESDLKTTVDVLALEPAYVNKRKTVSYLNNQYVNEKQSAKSKLYALWGLALLNEPILYELNQVPLDTLTLEEQVVLANAFAALGAYDQAYQVYEQFEKDKSLIEDAFNLRQQFELASLGAMLNLASAGDFYDRAQGLVAKDHAHQAQQVRYFKYSSPEVTPIDILLTVDGQKQKLTLADAWPQILHLQPNQSLSVERVGGSVTLEEHYVGGLENLPFEKVGGYAIRREVSASSVGLAERIEVTVTVSVPKKGYGQVLETIPSGFTLVEPYHMLNEKTIGFYAYESGNNVFKYTLKAKQKGAFILEPSLLSIKGQAFLKTEKLTLKVVD